MTEAPELMLNLSAWIERRRRAVGPYADHIIHSVSKYEAEIERLRAVAADLPAAVTVKPLEWQGPYACNGYRKGNWKAREFSIQREGKNRYRLFKNHIDRHETVFETLGEAKAAAQADYKRRILSCLTTQPDPAKDAAHSPIYDLIPLAIQEAQKGMRKFPQPNYVISKWAEETGEVTKALIHNAEGRESLEAVKGEIVQALAMLHRLFVEGDRVHGLRALAEQEQSDE